MHILGVLAELCPTAVQQEHVFPANFRLPTNQGHIVMKNKKKKKDETVAESAASTTTVARVTEIIASSPTSFEDAVNVGVARACKTLKNVTDAWVQDQKVDIVDGRISCFRVNLKVTFVLND